MITIGTRAPLTVLREKPVGLFLDAENLGEILLPRREMPKEWAVGALVDVFIYLDSEDRLVATLKQPRAMPG
jgi:predicted RNA-binding protein (virulence factor B family)